MTGPNFLFHQFANPMGIENEQGVDVPEWFNYILASPEHTRKPIAVICTIDQPKKVL